MVVISSNLWPGAHAYSDGDLCENIYVGWGQKYNQNNFSPEMLPPVMTEFVDAPQEPKEGEETGTPGLKEAEDPTVEEERLYEEAMAAKEEENNEDEEEEGDEEEEEDWISYLLFYNRKKVHFIKNWFYEDRVVRLFFLNVIF